MRTESAAVSHDPRFWAVEPAALLDALDSGPAGLSSVEAARRFERDGANRVAPTHRGRGLRLLASQFSSPIVLILAGATVLSLVLGDTLDGLIILAIILASGLLGFRQERGAGHAVDALLAQVGVASLQTLDL